MIGEATKQEFIMILDDPNVITTVLQADAHTLDCCYDNLALAEIGAITDDLFNDKHSLYAVINKSFVDATMWLRNEVTEIDIALTDDTYGTFFALGFYVTNFNEQAIGYLLDWNKVINLEGVGNYSIVCKATNINAVEIEFKSMSFCLKKYMPHIADGTVRLDWNMNGNIGSKYNDEKRIDYGFNNWYNSIRLQNSIFGFDTSAYEREFVKYQNGNKVWLKDSQIEEYELSIGGVPNEVHRFLKTEMFQSDDLTITDYNKMNATKHVKKVVIANSNYEPKWVAGSNLASVSLKFQQRTQNFIKKRS